MKSLLISSKPPSDWRDLQEQVNKIFSECGIKSEIEKKIETVRGNKEIDVFAEDSITQPPVILLCECKHWKKAVSQDAILSFRTVLNDYGADRGFIISANGFQSGAHQSVTKSAVRLLSWDMFQELYVERWIENYMIPRLTREVDPLLEYAEPVNTRVMRNALKLNQQSYARFIQLRKQHWPLASFVLQLRYEGVEGIKRVLLSDERSLNDQISARLGNNQDILKACDLRDFLERILKNSSEAVIAFDQLFGERV